MATPIHRCRRAQPANRGLALAVQRAGGQSQLGRLIRRAQPSVRDWLVKGTRVSAEDAIKIEAATGVPAETICPALAEYAAMRGLASREAKAA